MPIKDSAKKYMRVTARKTEKNRKVKGLVKNAIKKFEAALASDDIDKAQELLKNCQKALDKAAQKKVMKKNTTARKKSRLSAKVKKAKTSKA